MIIVVYSCTPLQLLDEYEVFVCYCEETGITWAENAKKILEKRGYSVYAAHMLRPLLQGNWQEAHDNIIRKCKIFIFINTLEALESPEIVREMSVAFPNGDTSKHLFWIVRDERFNAAYNSATFQQGTGINLVKQNQASFRNESDFNSIIVAKCLDDKMRPKERLEKEVNPSAPEKLNLSIKIRFAARATVNQG